MSAFLVSNSHLNAIVTFASAQGLASDPAAAVAMLTAANMASLRARYSNVEGEAAEAATYTFQPLPDISATQIMKACQCFDYQACESDDYVGSPAACFILLVEERALGQGAQSKGRDYESAAWEIN